MQLTYKKLIWSLFHFLDKDKKKFVIWNIPVILSNIFSLVQPLLIGLIIDFFTKYTAGQSLERFYWLLGLLLFGSALSSILRISARVAMFNITADLEYNIKTRGFDNIQNNSLSWSHNENSGNKIQRLETGKTALLDFIDLIKNDVYNIVISLVGILAVFTAINPLFLVFFAVYAILQFILYKFWDRKNPEYLARLNKAKELSIGKLFEGLNNIQTIKSLGATTSFKSAISNSQHELRESIKAWERLGMYKWISIDVFDIFFMVIFFLIVGYSITTGAIGVGFIFVLYTYFDNLQSITGSITNKLNKLAEIRANVERMLPLFDSITHSKGDKEFPTQWESIFLKNVCFEYNIDAGKAIFRNIDFVVNKGEFVGITGESGSGKSSLLKVLLGLYPIKSGTYTIGNTNFYDISNEEILKHITVVLQETELFNVSLLENVTMFKEVDATLLETSISTACLDEVIKTLPEGLDTVIGEKGFKLSGGQRQRIGVARAIYKNSPILLLDEATSNLDYETEKNVMTRILKNTNNKTVITVAHRLSTLEGATRVYKFENGNLNQQ